MGRRAAAAALAVGLAACPLVAAPGQATARAAQVGVASQTAPAAPMSLAAAKKKAKGTLHVALTGTGSYTVTGKGFRKSAQASKSFKVAAGAYKVSAPGASVSRGSVKVKAGKKVTVTVAFPPAPGVTPPPVASPPAQTPPPIQTPPPSDPTTPPPPPPAVDTTPPGKATGLTVGTRTTSSIALSWTNPGDPDLAEVIVRRAQGATAPTTPTAGVGLALGTPKASSVTDNALTAGTAYSYAVFTRDASNNTSPTPTTVTTSTTAAGPIQRVSTSAAGTQANGYSDYPRWSPDGTQIVFTSEASNLVPGDTNGAADVFVKTLATGAVQRVSTDAAGTQANGYNPQWSPDGTRIVFTSYASNLIAGDSNGAQDVFVKTLATGAVQRVSTDAAGAQADGPSNDPQWSADGTRIAFTSYASNLVPGDTNNYQDLFVKTLATGAVQRVSTDAAGAQANHPSTWGPQWSPDGTQIVFESFASNLVAGDTNAAQDVFVKTLATGAIQRVSTDPAGTQTNDGGYSGSAQWSPDGTRIVFTSYASNLVAGDTNRDTDVFVKTLATGAVQRVSTDPAGAQADGPSNHPQWSADGTRITFYSSATNLVAGDSNGTVDDVFVKTLASGAVQRVSTDAAGTQGNEYSEDPQWSPDGTQIAFTSFASNLVPGDTNGVTDVFVKTLP